MPPGAATLLAVLGLLLTKHWLCDFVLETRAQLEQKSAYGRLGGLLHGLTHVAGTAPVFLLAPVPVAVGAAVLAAELVVHYHVDWGKEAVLRATGWTDRDAPYWSLFGLDQLMHAATYLAIGAAVLRPW